MSGKVQHSTSCIGVFPSISCSAFALALLVALVFAASPMAQAQKTFKLLHTFTGGESPSGTLLRDSAGNLYGTTARGGTSNVGTVYKIDAANNETVLYSFTGGADGASPQGGVIKDSKGNLYGTASGGGLPTYKAGVVFKLDPTSKETVLYSFCSVIQGPLQHCADGKTPFGGLTRDSADNIFGTTNNGGNDFIPPNGGSGVVFELNKLGETVLYALGPASVTGAFPQGSVLRDTAGNFYGTATQGGGNVSGPCLVGGCGVVFKVNATGGGVVLFAFGGQSDGGMPGPSLARDSAGNLYGTTLFGGTSAACQGHTGCGTVFKLDPTGKETILHTFTGGTDGAAPQAGLVMAGVNLYGTASGGGTGNGTVFKVSTAGKFTVLHSFTGGTDGASPSSLVRDGKGNLYGVTSSTVYELSLP
jgi:uncharacterized repeat protein (TIGR03803 family)